MSQIAAHHRNATTGSGQQAGFTLVEVVAAAGVLLLGALGLVASLSLSVVMENGSSNRQAVHLLLHSKAEEVRGTAWDQLFDRYQAGVAEPFTTQEGAQGTLQVTLLSELQASESSGESLDFDGDGLYDEDEPAQAGSEAYAVRLQATWPEADGFHTLSQTLFVHGVRSP